MIFARLTGVSTLLDTHCSSKNFYPYSLSDSHVSKLYSVSGDNTSLEFTRRQHEETSLTFPQYDSVGPPSFPSLESESVDSSTAKASSTSDTPGPCEAKHNTFFEDAQSSNLTIDDEPKIANDSRLKERGDVEEEIVEPLNLNIGSILEDVEEDNEAEEMQNARYFRCLSFFDFHALISVFYFVDTQAQHSTVQKKQSAKVSTAPEQSGSISDQLCLESSRRRWPDESDNGDFELWGICARRG